MRKLKIGLGFLLVLGLGAMPAAAQAVPQFTVIETLGAEPGHGEVTPAHAVITGETTQAHNIGPSSFPGEGFVVKCANSTFSATLTETITPQMTVTVGYANCVEGKNTVDVRMNGCDYVYKVESIVEVDLYKGTLEIVCPSKPIEIEITAPVGTRKCLDTIPAQKGVGPIFYRNMTEGLPTDLTVVEEAENLTNITDNGFLNCGAIAIGHQVGGKLFGETTVRATAKGGEALDFEVAG